MTASAGEGDEQQWREWELELVEGASTSPDLLDRLANRLLDAGALPAGHGSKLARVLAGAPGDDDESESQTTQIDPIHRAVAEQVDQLVEWDRAVRADVYDSVHQMRVTTRKIRSLLQASEDAFGISDDAWILDELRQLASVLGVARDAEVLAERYERALNDLPDDLVRGPIRKRLVEGAKRRYKSGLRRSLIAMRSERYFRLLDALDGLVAAEPPSTAAGEEPVTVTIDSAYKRVRKAAKNAADAADEDRDEALHRIRKGAKRLRYTAAATGADKVSDRAKIIQTPAGRPSGQRGQPHAPESAGRGRPCGRRGHLHLRPAVRTGRRTGAHLPQAARQRAEETGQVGKEGPLTSACARKRQHGRALARGNDSTGRGERVGL